MLDDYQALDYAYGKPKVSATLKASPEDFYVRENLGFDLSGEGEHVYLLIEKRNLNTESIVKELSRLFGKRKQDIAYAGLKDKQAVTAQWFSLQFPGEYPDLEVLPKTGDWRVLETGRHSKKLKKGALSTNDFSILLRDISAPTGIEERLQQIEEQGVPNYFGEQRFGYGGQNLKNALLFLSGEYKPRGKFLKGIYYSALRAYYFNKVLSARVAEGSWNKALPGDVMQFADGQSIFSIDAVDEALQLRMEAKEISATAPLWGKGEEKYSQAALALQSRVLEEDRDILEALEQRGLERHYRALRLIPQNLQWQWQDAERLQLSFQLRPGAFATMLVRELFLTEEEKVSGI